MAAEDATGRQVPAEYVTRSTVLGRGWTQGAIARFLAEPDGTMANLRYRGSPPTRLYAMARVQAIEGTRDWQEWFHVSQRRRRPTTVGRADPAGVAERGEPPAPVPAAGSGGGRDGTGGTGGAVGPVAPVAVGPYVGAGRDAGTGRGRGANREVA
ncbi:hypothetical protein [Embleya sp. AB8]|uniref:hypothetical protein n=1 Tax=Embleya sp. AB8 TaxID=3156304 RepID=UPI003C73DE21